VKTSHSTDPNQNVMGLMEHLRELRKRLLYSLLFVTLGACGAYWFSSETFSFLCAPYFVAFSGNPLIGTSPAEAWIIKLKVAVFAGSLVVSPLLFHQLWLFIAPGLYETERRYVVPFVALSSALFCSGALFCYYQVLPLTLAFFFNEFASIGITPTIKLADHLSMTVTMLLGFGAVFEMPLLTFFCSRMGVLDHKTLISYFRHSVVAIFVVAAVLTPPDVLTQFLMAGPLLILYLVSIGIAYLAAPRPKEEYPVIQQVTPKNAR
jgi:sec-independent protein translocase protein TatC